jgi:hypothetical protein
MKRIVSISGGLGSLEALKRTVEMYGAEDIVSVFADVKGFGLSHWWSPFPYLEQLLHERFGGESRDTYRFLWDISNHFEIPIERIEDKKGRSIWAVFAEVKAFRLFVPKANLFYAPCSKHLKREVIKEWLLDNFEPYSFEIVLGFGWDEEHRLAKARLFWSAVLGYDVPVSAPLMDKPYVDNINILSWLKQIGLKPPSAYHQKFLHNNCGGGCVQAGQAAFVTLYYERPDIYQYWSYQETAIRKIIGSNVSILKDQRGSSTTPLTLIEFEERIKVGDYRKNDFGACGCFSNGLMSEIVAAAELRPSCATPSEKLPKAILADRQTQTIQLSLF